MLDTVAASLVHGRILLEIGGGMFNLVYGIGTVAVAFLLHLIWWRIRMPKYHTRMLLLLFFGVLIGVELIFALAGESLAAWLPLLPASAAQLVQMAILVTAFTLGYVITYSAVEADSPTLTMVRAIADAGAAGLSEEDVDAVLGASTLVESRLSDLQRDQMVVLTDGVYHMTPKGRRFVAIFTTYRNFLGAGMGG